jgi:hypothetical protein
VKYVLMFAETPQYAEDLAALGDAERQAAYDEVGRWFAENAARITHHVHLRPPHTATTMRKVDGHVEVTDGPFVEVEVADLDEALGMARSWPACPIVEIRPVDP